MNEYLRHGLAGAEACSGTNPFNNKTDLEPRSLLHGELVRCFLFFLQLQRFHPQVIRPNDSHVLSETSNASKDRLRLLVK